MLVSIIIVNYNVKYFLEYCLCSVEKAMQYIEGEIFVIDNNSSDGSRSFFENEFPRVKFIWNNRNEGFAKANNTALQAVSGDYILFLNPDTILPEDCFEQCISFIRSKGDQIACGVKMVDGSGKFLKESKRAFPSPLTSLFKLLGLTRLYPKSTIFSKYHLGYLDENRNHEVDVLAGAFMLVPKKIIDAVGGFDENFFMYGEDIDLSFRIQEAGFKNFYFSEVTIIHFKGESTKKGSLNYVRLFYKAMSVFAQKHFGDGRAGVFNLLIQVAIFFRACVSAMARFLRWIGLPVIDAGMILSSFGLLKSVWSGFVKREVHYSPNVLLIAIPAFTILFLIVSYFSGLYDNGYKQSRLDKSAIIAILVLLAAYSLLPEKFRFSRGILLFGSLLAFLLMTIVRRVLLRWGIIESSAETDEIHQTIIAGTQSDFELVTHLLQRADMQERVLGRVDPLNEGTSKTIGALEDLAGILKLYPVKEIIFCEGALSFKNMIHSLPQLPAYVRIKFFAPGMRSLLGSGGGNEAGSYIAKKELFRIDLPVSRRNKMLADVIISFALLVSFPLHFFTQKKPFRFFGNVWAVLSLRKTWIGYSLPEKGLPPLKPGVLTTTGLPSILNTLPEGSLQQTDAFYAENYWMVDDFRIVSLNYKLLGW